MRKIISIAASAVLMSTAGFGQTTVRHELCGVPAMHQALIAKDPAWKDRLNAQRASLQAAAEYYRQYKSQNPDERTTAVSAVPVIFHIVVDSAQFNALGGTAGIQKRCDSQIAVLNRDYNRQNPDSTSIPSGWKPLYSSVGIHFGLAHKDPTGACSPGFEVKIIAGSTTTDAGFSNDNEAFPEAKTSGTGLPSWDVTKYYNVWCINFIGSASGLLGLTLPLSSTGLGGAPVAQEGVCILYNTLGCTSQSGVAPSGTGTWYYPYNLGRTLTHETGHMFEIWHPWGDDGGQCPTWSSDTTVGGITCTPGVGYDDGLADTPPESDAVYGNPAYTVTGGTINDCCMKHGSLNTQPYGIACLSYMDYTDDDAMHMFTSDQAAAMAAMVLVPATGAAGATGFGSVGENYSLTQNPSLLVACSTEGVAPSPTELNSSLSVYPNPTSGEINVTINSSAETLQQIAVYNLLGEQVLAVDGRQGQDYYTLNLASAAKGVYFIRLNFVSGSVTRKIVLQ